MFNFRTLLKLLVLACVLVATAAAVSTPVSNQTTNTPDAAMKTALQPDLSLKSVIAPEVLFTPTQISLGKRHGFCRCSCGYPCETAADCGGASCDAFISCCAKASSQDPLQNGVSSRKDGEPDISIKCK